MMSNNSEDNSTYREIIQLAITSFEEWLPKNGEHFYSFNNTIDFEYDRDFFMKVGDNESHEQFSSIIHSIPESNNFSIDIGKQLWKEYEKIFYCGMIADEEFDENSWKVYKSKNKDIVKIYEEYQEEQEGLEKELIEATSTTQESATIDKISKHTSKWILKGHKREVENEKNKYFNKGEYSFASQWSNWKTKAENIVVSGEHFLYGNYEILKPQAGSPRNPVFSSISIHYKMLHNALNKSTKDNPDLSRMINDIAELRIRFKILDVKIPGFERNLFDARWWKFKEQYKGGVLLTSVVKKLILVDKVDYVYRSKNVFEAGVRIFTTGFPKFKNLFPIKLGKIILAGFICEKLHKVPNPDYNEYKFST